MRKNCRDNQKGITLIALIITIIVMLILVAVTVRTAINSGLFGHARNAVEQWAKQEEEELNLGSYIDDAINQYTYDDEYTLVVKRNETEELFNQKTFFIVKNDNRNNFRYYINLYIKNQNEIKKFTEKETNGYLCDVNGNYLMGWQVDKETEEIDRNVVSAIKIDAVDSADRIGTEFGEDGRIFAIYKNGSRKIVAQIAFAAFNNSMYGLKDDGNGIYSEFNEVPCFDGIGQEPLGYLINVNTKEEKKKVYNEKVIYDECIVTIERKRWKKRSRKCIFCCK